MRLSEIVKIAQKKLPLYTDYFSDKIKVESLSSVENVCTLKTEMPHNLVAGQQFGINGAKVKNSILSLTNERGLGKAIFKYPHQITKNYPLRKGDSTHITIEGATEEAFNGSFLIMDIPNSNVVLFSIDTDAPKEATGKPYILEDCYANYNGRQTVKEVIDENTVTFETIKTPEAENAEGDIYIRSGIRISGEFSIEHALEAYEAIGNNKLWGFCVLDGANVSKSRVNHTDAIATFQKGSDIRLELIQDFNFFVIIPTSSEYCWIDFVDLANDLRKPILKTFHKANFESDMTDEDTYLAFVGDNPVEVSTKAYMVYQYKFQSTINIQNEDGIDYEFEPALRELEMHEKNKEGTQINEVYSYGDIPDEFIVKENL